MLLYVAAIVISDFEEFSMLLCISVLVSMYVAVIISSFIIVSVNLIYNTVVLSNFNIIAYQLQCYEHGVSQHLCSK